MYAQFISACKNGEEVYHVGIVGGAICKTSHLVEELLAVLLNHVQNVVDLAAKMIWRPLCEATPICESTLSLYTSR